jgi:hypothetical protein
MTFSGISGEMFKLSSDFMSQIQQVAGVFGVSRGDVIPNARATGILNVYQEQEEKRNGVLTDKWIAANEKVAERVLDCAALNYKNEDARTVKIFGKNNQYKLRDLLDVSTLRGPVDLKIQRTTALADTKQGRIDQIVQLLQASSVADPTGTRPLLTREELIGLLELGGTDDFVDMVTSAIDAADSENEDMYEQVAVDPPQSYQYHIIHRNRHLQFMQSKEFSDSTSVPEEIRVIFKDHVTVHEVYMYQLAKSNAIFATELAKDISYPSFLKIGPESGLPEFQLTIAQIAQIAQMPPPPPMPPMPQGNPEQPPAEGEQPV